MQARQLHLYGPLAERYGSTHRVVARTIGEAVRIVDCNHPGFALGLRKMRFHVGVGSGRLGFSSETGEIALNGASVREMQPHHLAVPSSRGDWHLVPALAGGKDDSIKSIFKIVIGGALLATGIGGAAFGAFGAAQSATMATSVGFLGLSYGTVTLLGASLFLGGVGQLLAPAPKSDTSEKKPTSFAFDGPGEVDDEGGPIPIVIGEVITGGVRIASSVETASGISYGSSDPLIDYVAGKA